MIKTNHSRRVLGLSILLLANAGCDSGNDDTGGPMVVGGSGGTGASGGSGGGGGTGGGTGGGGELPEGVPLPLADGWVDASATVGIQGAVFAYADDTSAMGMTETIAGDSACITGEAAQVDLNCTPVPPATDCYGTFWGAAIGLNLNQPIDPVTEMGVDPPLPYDATTNGVTGFAFMVTGDQVPTGMRFKVENGTTEFCTPTVKNIKAGANVYTFEELVSECWEPTAATANPSAADAKSGLIKIAWHVVTNDGGTVPFDFCVSDIRALE
jgi:hypothetical protein